MLTSDLAWVLKVRLVLTYTSELSLLLPIWVGYRRWAVLQKHHKVVLWCCVMWTVLTVIGEILFAVKQHNLFVWNTVTILETLFLSYAFYLKIRSSKARRLLRIAAGVFVVLAVTDFFYLSGLKATTVYAVAAESVFLITTVLLYFEQLLQELRTTSLGRTPMFLIGIGVITYFAGTLMVFLLQNSVSGIQEMLMMTVNSVLSLVLNSIIAWAFFLIGKLQPPTVAFTSSASLPDRQTIRQ
ncbi:hypothetical protein [Hymenobacter volaticus]|uniref:Uncharacterized protein n=1 Tax=Hymenobacter volaticus TaxID=2932254 RepID=A0ABY4G9A9_9BACT|nr:hypothetical protein [Hymenobacter volaticus]UOQ67336.1 hypothetical protein MUN86_05490 [Hymenobacter volaticus]